MRRGNLHQVGFAVACGNKPGSERPNRMVNQEQKETDHEKRMKYGLERVKKKPQHTLRLFDA
jgi:hypothetical protein